MSGMPVYVEVGTKKTFVCSLDWPGWCRSAKDEEQAIEVFSAYAPRYAVVAEVAGVRFPKRAGSAIEVVERLKGDGSTDFGVPRQVATADHRPLTAAQARRQAALVEASWTVLDRVVKQAPASLRKGPRGGGRDRDQIVAHVEDAQEAYARKMGLRNASRADILEVLRAARAATPVKDKGWPPRYAARRVAWHNLDHAWEIEDRSS